jgi:hypothetical protein
MIFKYSQYPTPKGKLIYRPVIDIIFQNKKKFILVEAVIDSGADYTILPIEIAGELNIKLDKKSKETFTGAGKNPFNVYKSPVKIEHRIRQKGHRDYTWKSIVYFAESQPTILLGQHGFLDQFVVTLNGLKKELEIKKTK